jgi:adenylosuccinate synthase
MKGSGEWTPVPPGRPMMVNGGASLTTPYDVLLNQEAERCRGKNRHGSCGYGINETVQRNSFFDPSVHTSVQDMSNPDQLIRRLDFIVANYVPRRLEELGITPSAWFQEMLISTVVRQNYLEVCDRFRRSCVITHVGCLRNWPTIVFEGAQGLLLDQNNKAFFPYLTRSNTGLHNAVSIAKSIGISELDVIYVTRAYMTRHGPGPFPTEDPSLSYADATNVPNQWQGKLRFGHLDQCLLSKSICNDLKSVPVGMKVNPSIAVTCCDQVEDPQGIIRDVGLIAKVSHTSWGPTRSDVNARKFDQSVIAA